MKKLLIILPFFIIGCVSKYNPELNGTLLLSSYHDGYYYSFYNLKNDIHFPLEISNVNPWTNKVNDIIRFSEYKNTIVGLSTEYVNNASNTIIFFYSLDSKEITRVYKIEIFEAIYFQHVLKGDTETIYLLDDTEKNIYAFNPMKNELNLFYTFNNNKYFDIVSFNIFKDYDTMIFESDCSASIIYSYDLQTKETTQISKSWRDLTYSNQFNRYIFIDLLSFSKISFYDFQTDTVTSTNFESSTFNNYTFISEDIIAVNDADPGIVNFSTCGGPYKIVLYNIKNKKQKEILNTDIHSSFNSQFEYSPENILPADGKNYNQDK